MATAADIIGRATQKTGVSNELQIPDAFIQGDAFDELVDMLNRWAKLGILASNTDPVVAITIPTVPADELNNDAAAKSALISSLAMRLSPILKVSIKSDLRREARVDYGEFKALFGPKQQSPILPRSLPIGAGNNLGSRARRFFPGVEIEP